MMDCVEVFIVLELAENEIESNVSAPAPLMAFVFVLDTTDLKSERVDPTDMADAEPELNWQYKALFPPDPPTVNAVVLVAKFRVTYVRLLVAVPLVVIGNTRAQPKIAKVPADTVLTVVLFALLNIWVYLKLRAPAEECVINAMPVVP
jgi:hypothetical protein